MTPAERSLKARLAAHERWSRADGRAGTEAARAAFRDSFADAIRAEQPRLSEPAIAKRAASRRAAHFARMSLRSAIARRRKAASATATAATASEVRRAGVEPAS